MPRHSSYPMSLSLNRYPLFLFATYMMYLISACLAGKPVRYDAKAYHYKAIQKLMRHQQVILACPEMLGGLDCPRQPAEIIGGTAQDVLTGHAKVMTQQGEDVTQAFIIGAYKTLELAQQHQIKTAVLKENSPSCGRNFIYDGRFSATRLAGTGVTAALLLQHGFEVCSEDEFLARLTDL